MKISQEKIDYIKENWDVPNIKLAEILKIDRHTVGKYKKEIGKNFTTVHNFHNYDKYITDNYYNKTSLELAEEIGCSKSYISKIWHENGMAGKEVSIYHLNKSYFSKINTNNKAYIIGLLTSDGCLYKRENHQGLTQLSLHKNDKEILQGILIDIESNHPINISGNMATISITSDKVFSDLEKIGLHPRKTWTVDIEEILSHISKEYYKDFFRGYFDGDGCITSSDNYQTIAGLNITYALPESSGISFQKVLKNFNIECSYIKDKRDKYSKDFGAIAFVNTTQKYSFLKWIYRDTENLLKLKRKYEIASRVLERIENNDTNRSENIKAVKYYKEMVSNNGEN